MKYEAILFDYGGTLAYAKNTECHQKLHMPEELQKMITRLYKGGYRLSIVSNSHRYGDAQWLRNRLQEYGILCYFESVVSSGSWGIHKPNPDIYMRTLNFMGVHSSRAIMVGDSKRCDIKGSEALGMGSLYVNLEDNGIWDKDLINKLSDSNLSKRAPNIISEYKIEHGSIVCKLRHLSSVVKAGEIIIIGGIEYKIIEMDKAITHEEITDHNNQSTVNLIVEPV